MGLLEQLKALRSQLPETECYVVEWGRSVTLRGFTVLEGRKLRQSMGKDGSEQEDNEAAAIRTIAHAITELKSAKGDRAREKSTIEAVNGLGPRPFANAEGVEAIEGLSELTVRKLMAAFGRISVAEDAEGNSEPRAGAGNSSSSSPGASEGRSLN